MCVIKLLSRDVGSSVVLGGGWRLGLKVRGWGKILGEYLIINGNRIYNSLILVIHPKFLYRIMSLTKSFL